MGFWRKNFLTIFLGCFLLATVTFIALPIKVSALEVDYPEILGHTINDTSSIAELVCYFWGLGMDLAFFISVLTIAFGGVYYLVSFVNGKFTNEAQDWIKAGLTGLLITVCAALIASTINPALNTCQIDFLPSVNFNPFNLSHNENSNVPTAKYHEIPIGTLTEKLLTRTMDCYGFNQMGNPVDGDIKIATGNTCGLLKKCPTGETCEKNKCYTYGPTYENHDRADCLVQLIDGAQKKGNVIAKLSLEISDLMNQCDCKKYGNCKPECGENGCKLSGKTCVGDCVGGACTPENDCCPIGVKNQIEHGAITTWIDVGGNNGLRCDTDEVEYAGLDEFRCPNPKDKNTPCSGIIGFVEKQISVDDKDYTVIDKKKWGQLNLWQQLTYFTEKIEELKQTIIKDEKVLDQARTQLSNCYLALSYFDFLKIKEGTNQQEKKIEKIPTGIKDPITGDKVSTATYCSGFNYSNSSCFEKCDNECPDTSPQAIKLYSGKTTLEDIKKAYNKRPCTYGPKTSQIFYGDGASNTNSSSTSSNNAGHIIGVASVGDIIGNTVNDGWDALGNIAGDIWDAITGGGNNGDGGEDSSGGGSNGNNSDNNGDTSNGGDSNSTSTNASCISSCQTDCKKVCSKKYLECSDEYDFCMNQCSGNSECVLDTKNNCLIRTQGFIDCTKNQTDQGNIDYCINNFAYSCENGSDQYAGYQECTEPPSTCDGISNSRSCTAKDECTWNGSVCVQNYSASFLYGNPEYEKCYVPGENGVKPGVRPYDPPAENSSCYSSVVNLVNKNIPCQALCPEVTKCPASSLCPDCPCDQIDDTLSFSVPVSDPENYVKKYFTRNEPILAYQMVGPQCNDYSYNDDPLTFFCEENWWNNPGRDGLNEKPIGSKRICSTSQEIPVGQTVDSAIKWADNLISDADNMKGYTESILYLAKKLGDAIKPEKIIHDYCTCSAKFETTKEPICKTDCERLWNAKKREWYCAIAPCEGSPCMQMTVYISVLWDYYKEFKEDFIDFYVDKLKEPRSDIMKELTYSREKTNSCSLKSSAYGYNTISLNCTRAQDEIVPPMNGDQLMYNNQKIDNYCYGEQLGKIFNEDLTDNWFCCEEYIKENQGTGSTASQQTGTDKGPDPACLEEHNGDLTNCK